jgi:hypothetical protein
VKSIIIKDLEFICIELMAAKNWMPNKVHRRRKARIK